MADSVKLMCTHPTTEHPFYHVRARPHVSRGQELRIKKITCNGKEVSDFVIFRNNILQKESILKNSERNEIIIRCDWKNGEDIALNIVGESQDGKDSFTLSGKTQSPHTGGYWDPAWKYYASIVCFEASGLARISEPVHATLALYSDRVAEPVRELRLVEMDLQTGTGKEIPSQVLVVEKYDCKTPDERYQPTTVVDVAFFADVPANSSRVYLAFYGNPRAPYPEYGSDLKVKGEGLGLTIENSMYKVRLSEKSGAVDEITMKTGDRCTFEHHLETNGALHWNPDVYAPPRPWLHASDWNPPAHYSVNHGPLCVMTKRHGPLNHYPEIEVTITYVFYERLPWILISSTTEVKKDIPVQALRNGEIVLNRKIVDEFAWPDSDGGVGSIAIEETPRHPNHAMVLPHDTPWVCLFSRKHQCGLGVITANLANFIKGGDIARTFRHYSYLQWGPWVYYARPLVYTFLSNNPARLIPVPADSLYYEKMALVPIPFVKDKEAFTYLEHTGIQLKHPLHIKIIEDTDPRAPREWVPPILVEDFEEIEGG